MDERAQLEAAKKTILMKILDKNAYERLARVRIANPTLADQVELYLIQRAEQIKEPIEDEKLKTLLAALITKRKTKIMRR
jgi:DNA-binding TFAR19-related protein (PDSD5 family)